MNPQDLELHREGNGHFRYSIARHSWVMLGTLIAGVILVTLYALIVQGTAAIMPDEIVFSVGLVMIILGIVMLPAPMLDIISALRSRLIVTEEGLQWRGIGGSKSYRWDEIVAIGVPPESPRRVDDRRFHVLLEEDYEFIQGFNLHDRDEAAELMKWRGGFSDRAELAGYRFMCRRGREREVIDRATVHLVPSANDPWDFMSMRFRR